MFDARPADGYGTRSMVVHTAIAILLAASMLLTTAAGDFTSSACFNQTEKILKLNCARGEMVKVTRVIQGHNALGGCMYAEGDCVFEIKRTIYSCVGRQSCDINLPSGNVGAILHMCETHATYMHVDYQCVPARDVADVCDTPNLTGQSGYISSPRYPNNYPSNQLCTLSVQAPITSQKLRLYAVDLTLEADSESGCGDSLYIYDGHHGHTFCSTVAREQLMVTAENYLELQFTSNAQNRQKGFWLYYEAEPYMDLSTVSPSTLPSFVVLPPTLPLPGNSSRSSVAIGSTTTQAAHDNSHVMSRLGFPIGLVLGVLLGALLCALIIVLILIILRRRRLKMAQSASCASNMAIMASQLSKPVPPQTINNTLQPDQEFSLEKSDNRGSPLKGSPLKDHTHKIDKDIEIDMDFLKPAGPYKGQYIDKHYETGEDQLFC